MSGYDFRTGDGSSERDAAVVSSQITARQSKTLADAQATIARLERASQDQARINAELHKRIDEIETTLARISARLDAAEAVAELFADEPIPYELAQVA